MKRHKATLHCDDDAVTLRSGHKPLARCHGALSIPWLQWWRIRKASDVAYTGALVKSSSSPRQVLVRRLEAWQGPQMRGNRAPAGRSL